MGKFDFDIPADLIRQLEKLENYDNIAPKILNATVGILTDAVKKECEKHARTRTMLNSIKKTSSKKNYLGWYICVRPTGKSDIYMTEDGKIHQRKEPVRNMEVMAHAEYGTRHQPPTPILTKANNDARDDVVRKLQQEYNKAIQG